jgi:hypothetical protein
VRLPVLRRPPPSYTDVQLALKLHLARYRDGEQQVPNAWGVHLALRDFRRLRADLPHWSGALADELVQEHLRLGLPASGLVTVSFSSAADLRPGRFRVAGTVHHDLPPIQRRELLPGRPRLTIAAGGLAPAGSLPASGIDREVLLPAGRFVIGRDRHADLVLHDPAVSPRHAELEVAPDGARARLCDLGSMGGTKVDGVLVVAANLFDGSRIELGDTTLLFHRDVNPSPL